MENTASALPVVLKSNKFADPDRTATGQPRARVTFKQLQTLWFNTGTLCNLTCTNCYIESSPRNDKLVYLSAGEVREFLDEIEREQLGTQEIAFTGGEPFMNPEFMAMLDDCLSRGYRILVLTNAMKPMMKSRAALLDLNTRFEGRLTIRVSIDHYSQALHEMERGPRTWQPAIAGLRWLSEHRFNTHVCGRTLWGESTDRLRGGYARFFHDQGIDIDADSPETLVLLPEMDSSQDIPEITKQCWGLLDVSPDAMMCANSRMVVKRKGAASAAVVSYTLLPYETQFEMGNTLVEANKSVSLNHPNCSRICVLGGGSCSGKAVQGVH